jgi:hypothetical protein
MDVSSSSTKYTLHVQLPVTIQPEMITISAQKGDKLKVVADAWHMENNCELPVVSPCSACASY